MPQWDVKSPAAGRLERIAEFGIYAGDPIVRRSRPLQKTADGKAGRSARLNPATAAAILNVFSEKARAEDEASLSKDPCVLCGSCTG